MLGDLTATPEHEGGSSSRRNSLGPLRDEALGEMEGVRRSPVLLSFGYITYYAIVMWYGIWIGFARALQLHLRDEGKGGTSHVHQGLQRGESTHLAPHRLVQCVAN